MKSCFLLSQPGWARRHREAHSLERAIEPRASAQGTQRAAPKGGHGQGLSQRDADVMCLVLDVTGLSEKSHSACHAHMVPFPKGFIMHGLPCYISHVTLLSWSKAAR